MKNRKKGSALIVSIMVVTVISIMASGIYTVVMSNINNTKNNREDYLLFWAAQAGVNYGETYLRNIPISNFNKNIGEQIALPNSGVLADPDDLFQGCSVTVSAIKDSSGWVLESSASKEGKSKIIKLEGITHQTLLKYSECINSLSGGYWGTGYNFWGDVFVNSSINISGNPYFYGNVDVAGSDYNGGSSNYPDDAGIDMKFMTGIKDNNAGSRTNSQLEDIFKGEYNGSHPHTSLPDAGKDWTTISALTPAENYTVIPEPGNKVMIEFYVADDKQLAKITNGTTVLDSVNFTDKNALLISDNASANTYVGVKGEIMGEISVVTKQASIHIAGDLYYSSLKEMVVGSDKLTSSEFYASDEASINSIEDIKNEMQDNVTDYCALLAGMGMSSSSSDRNKGNILVDRNVDTDNNTPLFCTAGMYSPYGEISAAKVTNYAGDLFSPNNFVKGVPFLTYGSIIANAEGWTSSGSRGILMNPITDWRFKAGMGPKTFNIQIFADGSTSLSVSKWSVRNN